MYGTSSSEDKLARVRELGLQHGINYKQRDYVEAIKELTRGEGVDAVFEMLGGEHVAKSVSACAISDASSSTAPPPAKLRNSTPASSTRKAPASTASGSPI